MEKDKLEELLTKESNHERMNPIAIKFRNFLSLFNDFSKCYINIKKADKKNFKYDKIYGNDNIEINEKKKIDANKESTLEFSYSYRYEHNKNIFLIINSKNINCANNYIYHNDTIYIIFNNKKYEHMNLQKRKSHDKKKRKRKKKHRNEFASYEIDSDSTTYLSNDEEETNPMYNSAVFDTSNVNFGENAKKKKKKKNYELSKYNNKNLINSDEDSDNHYEHIFTHINSDLFFLSISNDHIKKKNNLYIQNEKYINYNNVIFRRLKFKKTLFLNLDTYNSWVIIKKNILLNEYWKSLKKNEIVDINDILYDVLNQTEKISNCYTRLYINDGFLLINSKTKEVLGVQKIDVSRDSEVETKWEQNETGHEDVLKDVNDDEEFFFNESNIFKLVLIKKMHIKYLFNNCGNVSITFHFHNSCLRNCDKINERNSYLLIHNYQLNDSNQILLNFLMNKKGSFNDTRKSENELGIKNMNKTSSIETELMNNKDFLYFNNYISQKIIENYNSYSPYIKECLLIIDLLYVLNNSYGNLLYIKKKYKYKHEDYYSNICSLLEKKKNHNNNISNINKKLNFKESSSVYSLTSENESQTSSSDSSETDISSIYSLNDSSQEESENENINEKKKKIKGQGQGREADREKKLKGNYEVEILKNELNNDLLYIMPQYQIIFHPIVIANKKNNSSNIEITKELLKLGIYIRKIQNFIEINKTGQSCNFTFDIFCCCLNNIIIHILSHINKIEENIRSIFNFTKINMKEKNDLSLSLFNANTLATCSDPEEKKIFFSINSLFSKNVQDFNLFFNINIDKTEDVSLYKIKISLLPLIHIAKLLTKIINKIIINRKLNNSKYVIDLVYKMQEYLNIDDINKKVLLYLLKNITTPLFDFIKNYIFYGKVKDIYKEFFIHENTHITPFYKQNHKIYHNNIYKYIFKKYIDLSTNYWGAKYILLNNKVPLFLKNVCNSIFITGKYINVLSNCSTLLNLKNKKNENFVTYRNDRNKTSLSIYQNNVGNVNPYNMSPRKWQHKGNNNYLSSDAYTNNNCKDPSYEEHEFYTKDTKRNKTCYLMYDNNEKNYEDLIHNQHLYASKKMFELYIKKIEIKEKIKHNYYFFFLQISDYLKYFYILAHEHLEKLYNNKKSNVLNKLKNYFDISIRSSVLYHLKYRKDYIINVSDILNVIDNINLIIDLKNFHLNNENDEDRNFNEDETAIDDENSLQAYDDKNSRNEDNEEDDEDEEEEEEEEEEESGYRKRQLNNMQDEEFEKERYNGGNEDENNKMRERNMERKEQKKKKKKKKKKKMTYLENDNNICGRNLKKKNSKQIMAQNSRMKMQNVQANINVEIYKGLILSYHNIFPYNLLFNNITIFKYTLIFRIINYCKYIEHKLTEVWLNHMLVKNIDLSDECKNNLMSCIHTRECMLHFLKCYLYHIQNDVIKSEYNYMNEKLKETLIFDDIILIHNNYLNNILKYSFIINSDIINCVLKLISVAHIFTRHILKFSFDRNEQLEKTAHENKSNGLGKDVVNSNIMNRRNADDKDNNNDNCSSKKNIKGKHHKKFIQELLKDKAYISMIQNTMKHYDKHFKNFFFLLTEHINNNIDDYAHNFLIKLDYNFYYTNKYKLMNQENINNDEREEAYETGGAYNYEEANKREIRTEERTDDFKNARGNINVIDNFSTKEYNRYYNNSNYNNTDSYLFMERHRERETERERIDNMRDNRVLLKNTENNNFHPTYEDLAQIDYNLKRKNSYANFKNDNNKINENYDYSPAIPNNMYLNERIERNVPSTMSPHRNVQIKNYESKNIDFYGNSLNQYNAVNANTIGQESHFDLNGTNISRNLTYNTMQQYNNIYGNDISNVSLNNINLSNIDINSIDSSAFTSKN